MDRLLSFAAIGFLINGNVMAGSSNIDRSWTTINCNEFELVIDHSNNYTSEQIRLHAAGFIDPEEPDSRKEKCIAIKKEFKDNLEFENYGISVTMLHVRSDSNPESFGNFGLIFNYQDKFNYDYVYISANTTPPIATTTVPPPTTTTPIVTTTALPPTTTTPIVTTTVLPPPLESQESEKIYYFQAGSSVNGAVTDTASIIINGTFSENVWHKLTLVIDKDYNSTVEIFLDDTYVGSFREDLAPRDVGGVMISDMFENVAVFKDFEIGRCNQFNSFGQCIEDIAPPNNCPSEYRLINGKCFFISNSTETYINSITECVIKGGKLYEPRDRRTYLTLMNYLKDVLGYTSSSTYRTWLAISDRKDEGNFVYESDGKPLEYENWQSRYGVDKGVLDETYECAKVQVYVPYLWTTERCNYRYCSYRYICETTE